MERLVRSLRRLPGIGEKSSTRLAYFLLSAPDDVVAEMADAIGRVKQDTVICSTCYNLSDRDPCPICADQRRDPSLVCVVEEPSDLASIEKSGMFSGLYHVLGGTLSPIDGVSAEDLRLRELDQRVRSGIVREVILATNPNAEGDATAHYIAAQLRAVAGQLPDGVTVTRIAYGMPLGGDLEYADHVTVGRSLENRRVLD